MYVDVYAVWETGTGGSSRRKRYRPTSEVQAALNERRALRRLRELVHTNFSMSDYAVHCTYRDGWLPDSEETAKKDLQAYVRRLKRLYLAHGTELKYIAVSSRGGKTGRVHHHLIINGGVPREEVEDKWGLGTCDSDRLQFDECGVADLTQYMQGQAELWTKRWIASRNLKQPDIKTRDHKYNRKKALEVTSAPGGAGYAVIKEMYPEYEIAEQPELIINEINGGVYVSMTMYRHDAAFCRVRRGGRGLKQKKEEADA